jgi:hypothetical protein
LHGRPSLINNLIKKKTSIFCAAQTPRRSRPLPFFVFL